MNHEQNKMPRNKVTSALAQLFFVATSMTHDDAGVELNDGALANARTFPEGIYGIEYIL